MNPITNFSFTEDQLVLMAKPIVAPSSVIANGNDIYAIDEKNGVVKLTLGNDPINAVAPNISKPNGISVGNHNQLLFADMQQQRVCRFDLSTQRLINCAHAIANKPLGKVNYAIQDSTGCIWFSVSTQVENHYQALSSKISDGYIAKINKGKVEIVADNLAFPNEIRLDKEEKFLYVAETTRRCISRFEITKQGKLARGHVFGPSHYGPAGFPDGIRLDQYGNLWVTLVMAEKIIALTPTGDCYEIFTAGKPAIMTEIDKKFEQGEIPVELISQSGCDKVPLITSIAFAGKENNFILVGHAKGNGIGIFNSKQRW